MAEPVSGEDAAMEGMAVRIEDLWKMYGPTRRRLPVPLPSLRRRTRDSSRDTRNPRRDDDDDDDDDATDEGADDEKRPDRIMAVEALAGIDLEVARGLALGIIGANASGKTTLLKVIARLAPPSRGRVIVAGRVAPLLTSATAFLQPEATGRDNVLHLAHFFGIPRDVVRRRMDDVIAFAGLEGRDRQLAKTYSSGQFRRLAFSIVLNLEPDIILADEVLSVGDTGFRDRCYEGIAEARARGMTLMFASEDLDLVESFCEDVVVLHQGRVHYRGAPREAFATYKALVGGRPAVELAKRDSTASPRSEAGKPSGTAEDARQEAKRVAGQAKTPRWNEEDERVVIGGARAFAAGGEPVDTIRTDEAAVVEIVLGIRRGGFEARCVLGLAAKTGHRVNSVQPSPLRFEGPSERTIRVQIPPRTLSDGVYRARVGVWIYEGGTRTILDRRRAFILNVIDPDPPADRELDEDPADRSQGPVWETATDNFASASRSE